MGLETATYYSQLVPTNPLGTDPKSQGDNHIQLLKSVTQSQWPNFTAAAVLATVAELNYTVGVTSAIQTQLNNKVSALNAALTGVPTAPTAAIGTNTTQIATTAYVINAVASGTTPAGPGDAGKFWFWDGATYSWRASGNRPRETRTTDTALAVGDLGKLFDLSAGFTQTLTAAATLGTGWWVEVNNAGNQDQIIDPSGAETIDGAATYTLKPGWRVIILCNGTNFTTEVTKQRAYVGPTLVTSTSSITVPADTYVIRAYAVGAGSAGSTTARGAGGGMAYGDIAVTPGQTVSFTISGGVAKVTTSAVDRLTANPASGATAGTASIDSSVVNGGSPSGGAGSASTGGGASSGSPLGAGVASGTTSGAGWGGAGASGGGGGSGGAATGDYSGPGVSFGFASPEPLLALLTGSPAYSPSTLAIGLPGGRGAGGGQGAIGGAGGIGGGGAQGGSGNGGAGGFGGGGGRGPSATGGAGGFGGGGGQGSTAGGAGGAAAILYFL